MYFLFIIPKLERKTEASKQGAKGSETEEALLKWEPTPLITLCCSFELWRTRCALPLVMLNSAFVLYISPHIALKPKAMLKT